MNQLYRLLAFTFLFLAKVTAQPAMNIPRIEKIEILNFEDISSALEAKTNLHQVALANWEAYPYAPEVSFRIAHDSSSLYLKFYVRENHILARRTQTNSDTHRDSCVEFFIDPTQSGAYYNFEFNCIGTTHLAYGPDRRDRTFIDPELIKNEIFIASTLGNLPFEEKNGDFSWEMTVVIPATVFSQTPNLSFSGLASRANFYKCGDETQTPHFLSWAKVGTPNPDFHRPEFFDTLYFE